MLTTTMPIFFAVVVEFSAKIGDTAVMPGAFRRGAATVSETR
jgi:hypothetical protein